jgi:hypothetical protein
LARLRRVRTDRPEATAVTVTLMVVWAAAYAVIFKGNVLMIVAGALLGFAMGGGK